MNSVNREDYLHRRSHHVENPESPSRIHTTTDPNRMDGSPIVLKPASPSQYGQRQNKTANSTNMAMCGDADYLTSCAAIPTAAVQLADPTGKCVIL